MFEPAFCKVSMKNIVPQKEKGSDISILLSPRTTKNEELILGYGVTEAGGFVQKHVHSYSEECFFVVKGQGRVIFEDGQVLEFEKHDAVRIPKNVAHRIENAGNVELEVVFASAPLAPTMAAGHKNFEED